MPDPSKPQRQKDPNYLYGTQALFPSEAGASMPPWLRMALGLSPLGEDEQSVPLAVPRASDASIARDPPLAAMSTGVRSQPSSDGGGLPAVTPISGRSEQPRMAYSRQVPGGGSVQVGPVEARSPSTFAAPNAPASASSDAGLQPAIPLTHYDGFQPGGDLQSYDGSSSSSELSSQPGFELAARRSRWDSPYPQTRPRPPSQPESRFGPRYEPTGEPEGVPNPADVLEYFAEFPKIRRDLDSLTILADRQHLEQSGRYRRSVGQGLFRVPNGSYTATTYSFNDPEQTMFVELPTWPDGYTLFEFNGVGPNRTWRTGNYPPRSLVRDPPLLRDPVYEHRLFRPR